MPEGSDSKALASLLIGGSAARAGGQLARAGASLIRAKLKARRVKKAGKEGVLEDRRMDELQEALRRENPDKTDREILKAARKKLFDEIDSEVDRANKLKQGLLFMRESEKAKLLYTGVFDGRGVPRPSD